MIGFAVCLLTMLVLHLLTPFWWWIMLVPFGWSAVRAPAVGRATVTGALSAGLLWSCAAAWMLYSGGSDLIAQRVAVATGAGDPRLLVILTGVLAALVGGLAGAAGAGVRSLRPRSRAARPAAP